MFFFHILKGCLNGGGQIRDENTRNLSKDLFDKVDKAYNSLRFEHPETSNSLYSDWLTNDLTRINQNLYTQYHQVEKLNNALTVKW